MSTSPAPAPTSRASRRAGRWRWLAFAALVVAVVAVGAYAGIGYYAYQELSVIQPRCGAHLGFAQQTPADFQAFSGDRIYAVDTTPYRFSDYQDVAFPSRGSTLTIRGWFAPGPKGTAGPAVVLVHGRESCRRDPNVMLPAGMLHQAGFAVLLIDLRNHGDSDADNGRWAGGDKEFRDVLGAWDWLVGQGYARAHVGLFGASLGAGTVTIATGQEPRVAATWADSSYASFDTAVKEYAEDHGYPSWVSSSGVPIGRIVGDPELGTLSPDTEAAKLKGRPFFIVQGMADTTVRPHHSVDLAVAACGTQASSTGAVCPGGTKVEPWLIPGARHTEGMLLAPDRYRDRLVEFFTGALGSPA